VCFKHGINVAPDFEAPKIGVTCAGCARMFDEGQGEQGLPRGGWKALPEAAEVEVGFPVKLLQACGELRGFSFHKENAD
jgi:hypothetical protein